MKEYIKGRIVGCRPVKIKGTDGIELDIAEHEGILKPEGFVRIQMDSLAFSHLIQEARIQLRGKGGDAVHIFKGRKIVITVK